MNPLEIPLLYFALFIRNTRTQKECKFSVYYAPKEKAEELFVLQLSIIYLATALITTVNVIELPFGSLALILHSKSLPTSLAGGPKLENKDSLF